MKQVEVPPGARGPEVGERLWEARWEQVGGQLTDPCGRACLPAPDSRSSP